MLLITSAAYVTSGLLTEYGKIPAAFLPLQNKRLYEHQLNLKEKDEKVVISLPLTYCLSDFDKLLLEKNNVNIVFVPDNLTLGQSVVYVLNVLSDYAEPLRLLHGDTLFKYIPSELDIYLIDKVSDNYNWTISEDLKSDEFVYAGFFSFSNQSKLIQCITESNYDFVKGILAYKKNNLVVDKLSNMWLDFGHVNTFYRSKTYLTTQRYFNNLKIDNFSVIKSSSDNNKILAEAEWYSNVPIILKKYLPALWGKSSNNNDFYYEIEYLYLSSLAELFVFGENETFVWQNILNSCDNFLLDCKKCEVNYNSVFVENINNLYEQKTIQRLSMFSNARGIDVTKKWKFNGEVIPSIFDIITEINKLIRPAEYSDISVIHGDFGFSNILYNFRTQSIKVVDPRGVDVIGNRSIFGDIRYDIAKLAHSVLGLYDFIIAGKFVYQKNADYDISFKITCSEKIKIIQDSFKLRTFANMSIIEASTYPILIDLFFSMLPLHKDSVERQDALLANAFRLYLELKKL